MRFTPLSKRDLVLYRSTHDATRQSYDEFAEAFTQRYFSTRLLDNEMDAFLALLPPDPLLLDAGSGPGHQAHYFSSKGARAIGLDLSYNMLQNGRLQEPSLPLIQGDLLAEPFADRTFDGIWARASLIHFAPEDHRIALNEFQRILKPHGLLYAAVRQGSGEELRHEVQNGISLTRYFHFWTAEDWHQQLHQSGFRILHHGTESGAPEDWLWIHAIRVEDEVSGPVP